jgi:hypothetical protein
VEPARGDVHDLHGGAGRHARAEIAGERGHATRLVVDPRRVHGLHRLGAQHQAGRGEEDDAGGARQLARGGRPGATAGGGRGLRLPRAQGGRGEDAEEERHGIEVIFPALALEREMEHARRQAREGQGTADAEARPRGDDEPPGDEGEQQRHQRARVGMAADRLPEELAAEPRVEGEDIAGVLRHEGGEPAAPREPPEHQREHGDAAGERGADPQQRRAAGPARGQPARGQPAEPEEPRRIGLHGEAGGERRAAHHQRPEWAGPIPGARQPQGADSEKEAQEEITLPRLPGPTRQVIQGEEQRRAGRARTPAQRQAEGVERGAGGEEPAEVEEPPGEVARAEGGQHRPVEEINAGQVHVEEVAVRHQALAQQPPDVVEQGRVVNQRPAERAPAEISGEQRANGQSRLQSPARPTGSRREALPRASPHGRARTRSRRAP